LQWIYARDNQIKVTSNEKDFLAQELQSEAKYF
jgi:hypothetical protein